MNSLLSFLDGKKTYLISLAALALLFGTWQGWWKMPTEFYEGLAALGLMFLRSGVAKSGPAAPPAADGSQPVKVNTIPPCTPYLVIAAAGILIAGCTAPQQRIAFKTLYSIEQTTTAAVDSYDTLVINGAVPTNDVPRVAAAFNTFQASFLLALDAAQFNTNAIAPPNLIVESQDLVNLITTLKAKPK